MQHPSRKDFQGEFEKIDDPSGAGSHARGAGH